MKYIYIELKCADCNTCIDAIALAEGHTEAATANRLLKALATAYEGVSRGPCHQNLIIETEVRSST